MRRHGPDEVKMVGGSWSTFVWDVFLGRLTGIEGMIARKVPMVR